jgi:hypothetical protein
MEAHLKNLLGDEPDAETFGLHSRKFSAKRRVWRRTITVRSMKSTVTVFLLTVRPSLRYSAATNSSERTNDLLTGRGQVTVKKAVGFIGVVIFLFTSCGGGSSTSISTRTASVQPSIALSPGTQQSIDAGQTVNLTANVTYDSNSQGVSWSVSGSDCSGNACGSLANISKTSATYRAPSSVVSSLTVTVKATSVAQNTVSASLTVVVNPSPSVTTTSLPAGALGTLYGSSLKVSGGTGNLIWSLTSGSLPAGLSLNAGTGKIFGTPTLSGTTDFTVKVTDSAPSPESATQSLSLTIAAGIIITTTSLPNGSLNAAYDAFLQATGGMQPYSWSITSGNLPAGLSLNAGTGEISGAPTASGTSNFTVQVTDSAASPESAKQSLTITVTSPLIFTTTLLPNGSVNAPYSATLQASGGTKPYSWSIMAGSLPAGLSLNATTGVISGTPTASAKPNFTVQVTDASTNSATQPFSITIEPAVTITTTSLADGTLKVAYGATVGAAYATLPVSWSISSGALPTGLTLNASTGSISGTPLASGTSNFTVMVTDSSNPPQTATRFLSITINSAGANNTVLSGRYAMLLSGYDTYGNRVGVAGSFMADGAGNITSGVEDLNDTGIAPQASLTINSGTYSMGEDNRGNATFINSSGSTYTMAIAVGNLVGGTALEGSVVEFDSSGYLMSGVIELQNSASFLKQDIAGNYALGFTGSGMAGDRLAVAGQFTADGSGGITGGVFDADDSGTPTTGGAIDSTSAYNVDTTTGRCALTLSGISPAPSGYVAYIVSASRLLVLSMDTASTSGLVTGEIDEQTGGPYLNGSLSGPVVMGADSSAPDGSLAVLGVVTFDGSGNATFSMDENNAGTLATVTGSGTYTTPDASTGRFALTPPPGLPTLTGYLVSVNQAFVVGADSSVMAGKFQAQSAGTFSNSSLNLNGFFGDKEFATAPVPPPYGVLPATLGVGAITFDGAGNTSFVSDRNIQGTLLPGQATSTSYSVASIGRVTLGSGSLIFYMVSPTEFVFMSTTTGDPNPKLGLGGQ